MIPVETSVSVSVAVSMSSTESACDGMPTMKRPQRAPPCHFHPPRGKLPSSSTSPLSGTILRAVGALYGIHQIAPSEALIAPYHLFLRSG